MAKSKFHFFSVKGKYFAYEVNTTICTEIDELALSILSELLDEACIEDIEKKYAYAYSKSAVRECIKECSFYICKIDSLAQRMKYTHSINNQISYICLHISHECNLNCAYCYADSGSFGRKRLLMSKLVMSEAIDFAFSNSGDASCLNVGFFGGEPLINQSVIRECIQYSKTRAKELGKSVVFSMTSNAVLLNPAIMDLMQRENFSLIFSLDGKKRVHDFMRKSVNGKGSYSHVIKNIKTYSNCYSNNFTVRGTFTRCTPNFSDQVIFLNDLGFKSVSVEPAELAPSHPYSITKPSEILRINLEYDKLAEKYIQRFDAEKPMSFFHFDYYLKKLLNPYPMYTTCGAGGGFISVTPDGNIFPCFESAVEENNCIGHIKSGFDDEKRMSFQRIHVDSKKECAVCWFKYCCGGGCSALNIRFNDDIEIPYKAHCEFMKHRFELSAWILSEVKKRGENAIGKLKSHLNLTEQHN